MLNLDQYQKPMEKAKAIIRFLGEHPNSTLGTVSRETGEDFAYLIELLHLHKLSTESDQKLRSGEISLGLAYMIRYLPKEEQSSWLERPEAKVNNLTALLNPILERIQELRIERRNATTVR